MTAPTALHTDLYQLTMALGYLRQEVAETPVVCEAFVRRLPRNRSCLLVAGLAPIVDFLRELHFTPEQVEYLRSVPTLAPALDDATCAKLLELRFTGDLWAMPEGSVAFANEPLLRVEAPLWQAQLVETTLLSILNHATLVASKAARIVAAAGKAEVMEFGTRRTQTEAAVHAARAATIAGCVGSSNVAAGLRFGLPVFGTMAHMWTMVHDSEAAAFDAFLKVYPHRTTLLVDTYGTLAGTQRACEAARRAGDPDALSGIRIDSDLFDADGTPTGICRAARTILDDEGFSQTKIIVSDDMNEDRIGALLAAGEPIDAFGVGTGLVTSKDAPALGGVYKVVWVGGAEDGHPVSKLSPGKVTYPGAHQVRRQLDDSGQIMADTLTLADEDLPGTPMLRPYLRGGEPVGAAGQNLHDLKAVRRRAAAELASLGGAEAILQREPYLTVQPSQRLQDLVEQTGARLRSQVDPQRTA
jgi:nicotinate phosphoribosyltransferase